MQEAIRYWVFCTFILIIIILFAIANKASGTVYVLKYCQIHGYSLQNTVRSVEKRQDLNNLRLGEVTSSRVPNSVIIRLMK